MSIPASSQRTSPERFNGTVIRFLNKKGYGFILGDDGRQVFVHFSDLRGKSYRTLTEGEAVEYSVVDGAKGLQAVDVVRLDPPPEEDLIPPVDQGKRTW